MSNKFKVGDVVVALNGFACEPHNIKIGNSYYVYSIGEFNMLRVTQKEHETNNGLDADNFRLATPYERVAFFAEHKELHPNYRQSHKLNMKFNYDNFRYMEPDEVLQLGDYYIDSLHKRGNKILGMAGFRADINIICMCPKDRIYTTKLPTPEPFRINAVGFYKAKNGLKAEVSAITKDKAFGFLDGKVKYWALDGMDSSNCHHCLVEVWQEPIVLTQEVYMYRLGASPSSVVFSTHKISADNATLIGSKQVTITEGDTA